jgi:epoxide hydrolase 4
MVWEGVEIIRVAANGITFEVAAMGSGERLALCLHGFPEHAYSWRHQLPLLARLGYRCWAPNLRGYGATDSPREVASYRSETLVGDVAGLIQASGSRETLVMAHDWGAALAWMLAMEQPRLVQRLVILNLPHPACFLRELQRPVQFAKSWYMLFFQLPRLPEFLLGRGQGRATTDLIRRTCRDPARFPADALEVYRQNAARPGGLTAMLNWYRALFRGGEIGRLRRARYPKIDTPTLFLWGDADAALSLRTTRGTAEYVTNLTFRVFPGVSHWIQQEQPEAVNAMLEAWLTGAPVPQYTDLAAVRQAPPNPVTL